MTTVTMPLMMLIIVFIVRHFYGPRGVRTSVLASYLPTTTSRNDRCWWTSAMHGLHHKTARSDSHKFWGIKYMTPIHPCFKLRCSLNLFYTQNIYIYNNHVSVVSSSSPSPGQNLTSGVQKDADTGARLRGNGRTCLPVWTRQAAADG